MLKNAIWITGAEGRLGSALVALLKKDMGIKVVGTDLDVDITDMEAVEQCMKVYRPNVVINCASISDAEYCEKNMVEAFKVNALGARNLAAASRRKDMYDFSSDSVLLVLASTHYDGKEYIRDYDEYLKIMGLNCSQK